MLSPINNRFTVNISMNFYADNIEDAQKQAEEFCEEQRKQFDNNAVCMSVIENEFGVL